MGGKIYGDKGNLGFHLTKLDVHSLGTTLMQWGGCKAPPI
jgi:hypothetical protein